MTVYLDLLFLFNFGVNVFFLYVLALIYRERVSWGRITAGGLLGGTLVFAFLFDYVVYLICKLAGGLLVAGIGFKGRVVFVLYRQSRLGGSCFEFPDQQMVLPACGGDRFDDPHLR